MRETLIYLSPLAGEQTLLKQMSAMILADNLEKSKGFTSES